MVTLVRFRAELIFFFTILLGVEVLLLNIKYDEIDRRCLNGPVLCVPNQGDVEMLLKNREEAAPHHNDINTRHIGRSHDDPTMIKRYDVSGGQYIS